MIKGLLLVDPLQRLNVFEALNHSWMNISSLKIVEKKFQNTPVFGDSFEKDFKDLSILNDNSTFKTYFLNCDLKKEEFQENNFNHEDNLRYTNMRLVTRKYGRNRSESI